MILSYYFIQDSGDFSKIYDQYANMGIIRWGQINGSFMNDDDPEAEGLAALYTLLDNIQ